MNTKIHSVNNGAAVWSSSGKIYYIDSKISSGSYGVAFNVYTKHYDCGDKRNTHENGSLLQSNGVCKT